MQLSKNGLNFIRKRVSKVVNGSGSEPDLAESGSDSDLGVNLAECKIAGRAIARCYDMFADVNKVISVVLLSKQAAENEHQSDSEDEGTRQHRDEFLSQM